MTDGNRVAKLGEKMIQTNKERAANAIHLTKFAHGKSQGTKRAIQKYREKQQAKFLHKAKLLRSYKKTMKQEGYEPGKGASRRRNDSELQEQDSPLPPNLDTMSRDDPPTKPRTKMDPFAKAKWKGQQMKQQQEQIKLHREEEAKVVVEKKIERARRTKQMMQRTKKTGQPIMKFVIQGMLHKIKNDQSNT